ncbi:MAG TPA: branched-chain amino acid ABC transporter substrate-binding protein [Bacillota bacterium]
MGSSAQSYRSHNRRFGIRGGLALVMAAALLVLAACGGGQGDDGSAGSSGSGGSGEPIVIGVIGPMTGDYAAEGQGFQKAIDLVVADLNAHGGVLGRQVDVEYADSAGQPNQSTLAAQELVSKGVVAVVGSYSSTETEAAMEIFHEEGILQISPSSTATHLTEKGYENFFRTAFLDSAQGMFAARMLVQDLGAQRVAIIHDNSTYALGLAEWTRQFVEDEGGEVVFFDALNPQETDYSALLTAMQQANPDALYFTGYFSQAGLLIRQAREQGIDIPIAGGNATNNDEVINTAGEHAEGFITTTEPLPPDLPYPAAQEFVEAYRAEYNEDPVSIWTAMAADAFNVIIEAIRQTESTDSADLIAYLRDEMDGYQGITGPITFDEKGDREGTIYAAYRIENGEFVLFIEPQF